MEVSITSVRENPLLGRKKVEVSVDHEGEATPSKEDVKSRLAAEKDLDEEEIELESIYTGFGSQRSRATLKVYQELEYDEELEEKEVVSQESEEAQSSDESGSAEYEEIVSGTITEAKDALKDVDEPDYEAALEAEKQNKNRTTLIDWLESRA